ncbi:carbohydrate-binding module family 1 protein [Piromyces sp. E2]|nr:carbohydrate-binding module family 1 protein [Piromyces sp. E2]|eukprot:OUM70603.1 carbohydrate-binding module family 1 protein [Piromyces sp. E2]
MQIKKILLICSSVAGLANAACSGASAQCGGVDYQGENCCIGGYSCEYVNEWYSECVPINENGSLIKRGPPKGPGGPPPPPPPPPSKRPPPPPPPPTKTTKAKTTTTKR